MKQVIKYFACYNDAGQITGLYNSRKHGQNIPESVIPITTGQRDQIVWNPSAFHVDTENKSLEMNKKKRVIDVTPALSQNKYDHDRIIATGVKINGRYYYADDEASAHITQCLVIAQKDNKFVSKLRSTLNGVTSYEATDYTTLKKIAIAVNELRVQAKEARLESDIATTAITYQ